MVQSGLTCSFISPPQQDCIPSWLVTILLRPQGLSVTGQAGDVMVFSFVRQKRRYYIVVHQNKGTSRYQVPVCNISTPKYAVVEKGVCGNLASCVSFLTFAIAVPLFSCSLFADERTNDRPNALTRRRRATPRSTCRRGGASARTALPTSGYGKQAIWGLSPIRQSGRFCPTSGFMSSEGETDGGSVGWVVWSHGRHGTCAA